MPGNERYGHFRYGVYEYQPPDTPGFDQPLPERDVTPEEAFGRGIALKPTNADGIPWDIAINPAGDFALTSGWQELGKDIAFEIATSEHDLIGVLSNANARVDIETSIRRLVRVDDRVGSVERVDIRAGDGPGSLRVRVRLTANSGDLHDVVVPVSRPRSGSEMVQDTAGSGDQEQEQEQNQEV